MATTNAFEIAVLPGDGIGPEVMRPCLELLDRLHERLGGFRLRLRELPAGAGCYLEHGTALPEETLRACEAADAVLLGAMGLPNVRYGDGTEIAPQLDLRTTLGLYAGVRPVRTLSGAGIPLADWRARRLDLVLIRESTEGLFARRREGVIEDDRVARDVLEITREVSERLFGFAFELARRRKAKGGPGIVTCVDKANVLTSFAFFRRVFDETASRYPDIGARHHYVDATALDLVRRPWIFDVLVTENMFGDILSDVGAALMGGMGMAPSADVGDAHAVFQPCHGSAPDIAGRGLANPTAMFLSAAMMLEWLGERHRLAAALRASELLSSAVEAAYAPGELRSVEQGGEHGTAEVTRRVATALDELARGGRP